MRLQPEPGVDQFVGFRFFQLIRNVIPALISFSGFKSKIVVPDVGAGDPAVTVEHVLPPWLLLWFAGPELQASNESTHDLEEEEINVFRHSIWVSIRCAFKP